MSVYIYLEHVHGWKFYGIFILVSGETRCCGDRSALKKAEMDFNKVDEVFMGNVVTAGVGQLQSSAASSWSSRICSCSL